MRNEKGQFVKGFKNGYESNLLLAHGWNRGKHWPEEILVKLRGKRPSLQGGNHYLWKGDAAKVKSIHNWLKNNFGKATHCELCSKKRTKEVVIDWANKNHKYKRTREDWFMLCRSCHRKYDIKNNNYKKYA